MNLLFDRYFYDYGLGRTFGEEASPVRIRCILEPPIFPPIPDAMPQVGSRVGIDVSPINAADHAAATWLRACVWPEMRTRAQLLERALALALAASDPPPLIRADASTALAGVVAHVPDDLFVCVFHSHTLPYISEAGRARLFSEIETVAATRDLAWIGCEAASLLPDDPAPGWVTRLRADRESRDWFLLQLKLMVAGGRVVRYLAQTAGHGTPIRWHDDGATARALPG